MGGWRSLARGSNPVQTSRNQRTTGSATFTGSTPKNDSIIDQPANVGNEKRGRADNTVLQPVEDRRIMSLSWDYVNVLGRRACVPAPSAAAGMRRQDMDADEKCPEDIRTVRAR